MAQLSYPFENQDTTETQYSYLFSALQETGVAGPHENAGSLYAAIVGTGMQVVVYPGRVFIRGFMYENTSDMTLTLDNGNTQPRIDVVILRLDPAANSIVAAVKKGTPGSSPVAPALTQTAEGVYEFPLLQVLVPANATAIGPSDGTGLTRSVGRGIAAWNTNSRPTFGWLGQIGYNATTDTFEWWNGAGWLNSFPVEVSGPGKYVSVPQTPSTSFVLQQGDIGTLLMTTASAAVSIQIPTGLMTTGQRIDIVQDGTGQVTISPNVGVTLQSKSGNRKISAQYGAVSLVCVGTNAYRLIGDLSA